tara:strand:+ start:944 stop:1276 length:333 start_codon:yes stop_codon:yes gene_type:complete
MSWESTLKASNENSGEYPSHADRMALSKSYAQLSRIRDSMVEKQKPMGAFKSKYPIQLMQQLPTMREVDDMLATMAKIVNASWDEYNIESRRPAFMDRAEEALRQERMNR